MSEIKIIIDDDHISIGDTIQIKAEAVYPDGSSLDVTDEADWSSSDTEVAAISEGLLTANGNGTTQITASYQGVTSDPATITVGGPVGLPWWIILAIIIISLGAGLWFFFALGRRRRRNNNQAAV